jgi:16S rRNA (guanine527-N7)-methyltransferase
LDQNAIRLLQEKAAEFGIGLTAGQADLFRMYLDELWEWNRRINLTGLSSPERIVIELFLDSLIPAPFLPRSGPLLDVGSGSGLPGIPLKIYHQELELHLLDAHSKRISFLKQVVRRLSLKGVTVIHGRIEERSPGLLPGGYPLITARALAPLDRTIALCDPFLSAGGGLIGYLGKGAEKLLADNAAVLRTHRLSVIRKIPYRLPGKKTDRMIVFLSSK